MNGQPLPQVLPSAALFVLGPRHGFSIGAVERREQRGDSACALAGFPVASPMVGGDGDLSKKDILSSLKRRPTRTVWEESVFELKDVLAAFHCTITTRGLSIRIKDHLSVFCRHSYLTMRAAMLYAANADVEVGTIVLCVEKPGMEPQAP